MSEPIADPTPAQEPESTDAPDVDWKAKSREWERRAKENKSAADKLAELEESQKTAEQKSAERLAEAERKAAEADFRINAAEVAATNGLPVSIVTGPKDKTADALTEYAKSVLAWADGRSKPKGNYVPNEGRTSTNPAADDMRVFTRQLFNRDSD